MINKMKTLAVTAAVTLAMPVASFAATINGQIDIDGFVDVTASELTGDVIFVSGTGEVNSPAFLDLLGDFAETVADGMSVTLNNIDFDSPGIVWEVGSFIFTATNFYNVVGQDFNADGIITDLREDGFDPTKGFLEFSTQGNALTASFSSTTTPVPVPAAGLLLLAGIGALGVAGRRKAA